MNSIRMSNAFPHCRGKSRQGENRQNLNVFVMLVQGVFEYVSVNIPGHVRIYIYIWIIRRTFCPSACFKISEVLLREYSSYAGVKIP